MLICNNCLANLRSLFRTGATDPARQANLVLECHMASRS
jgi:hypothetical protein